MEGIQPTLPINDGFGGGSGIWLFAILALMLGGFGGNRFGNDRIATTDDLNFNRLENQVRANENYIQSIGNNLGNGIANVGYEMAKQFGNTNMQMASGFCGVDKAIMENRYLTSKEVSEAKAEILGVLAKDKIEALQGRISQLELQQAMCGVVKYPSGWTYNAGSNPFCGGCGNNY